MSAKVGQVARLLAPKLGLTEGSAHQVLHGHLAHRAAAVIESFYEAGDYEGLTRWAAPIVAALDRYPIVPVSPDLLVAAQEADAAEDVAETAYHVHRSRDAALEWFRRLLRESSHAMRLARGLAERYGFTL